jgi:heparosan-N-sulfate-glucuronate 5-epimerase
MKILFFRSPQAGRVKLRYFPSQSVDVDHIGRMAMFGYGIVGTQKLGVKRGHDGVIYEGDWKRFTRNLINDVAKGLPHKNLGSPIRVEEIALEGVGCITNLTLSTRKSLRFFFHAADWLIQQQDDKGGWPVGVTLNKDQSKYSQADEIPPGWYSGMGQGHAMSVLTRAYKFSKDEKFLLAAIKALHLFEIPSSEGGVVARFMDTPHIWYEEYPTKPSSFILNGFMYSLLGLYDLWATLEAEAPRFQTELKLSRKIFDDGIESLFAILPFYDSGSGTFYDLRHFSMSTAPKVSRWDYHSTHINLLHTLSTLVDGKSKSFFLSTADRWLGYMTGNRSKHN